MAQIVKLRRSSVIGKKPTNAQLELGELSINTSDGKVYFAKSGSLGPSIEELVSTNTVNTGSIYLTGDVTASHFSGSFIGDYTGDGHGLYNIPASGVTGLSLYQITSGSVTASISPDHGFQVNTNSTITGSLIVSGSMTVDGPFYFHESSSFFNINGNGFGQTYLQSPSGAIVLNPGYGGVEINGSNPDLKVNGNVNVDGYISSSTNFRGDGSGLFNVPISGVTNLSVNKIYSGSVSASISPDRGLEVNTDLSVSGSVTGSFFVGDGSHLSKVGYTEKLFYVSEDGNDLNDGKTLSTPFRTIKAAANAAAALVAANPPNPYPYRTSIHVKSGYYVEEAPITLANNVSVLGDDLRSVVVRPTEGTKYENLFHMNNGTYVHGLRLEGCIIDNLEDPRNGFFFAFAPGAYITTSPYVQNCSAINTPFDKFYTPLDFTNGNPLVGNGPGGMLIDDSVLDPYSPLHSMIVDSYTQVAFNGIGMCARGRGYGQMVSFFTNFSRVGVYSIDGGHASLLNSNTTFGDYGLRSKGTRILVKPNTSLVTGTTVDPTASLYIRTKIPNIQAYMISQLALYGLYSSSYSNTGSTIYKATIKDSGLLINAICDDLLSPVVTRVSQIGSGFFVGQDTTTGFTHTLPTQSGFTKGAVVAFPILGVAGNTNIARDFVKSYQYIRNYFLNDPDGLFTSISGATITKVSQLLSVVEDTIQRVIVDRAGGDLLVEFGSLITSTSHDFSYAGSGVNFLALPINQGGVGQTNLDIRVYKESGGRVFYTAGDETGDYYAGNGFIIRQETGTIEGRTFTKAISAQITPINLALETY